jgi:RNA polymerase sigma-70 factor (ECF subfamily)
MVHANKPVASFRFFVQIQKFCIPKITIASNQSEKPIKASVPNAVPEAEPLQPKSDNKQGLDPGKWLDLHGDYLYRYALMRVREAGLAEDLLQETLLAAIGSCDRHAGRSSERTWLVGIMKHKVVDHFRRLARSSQFQLLPEHDDTNYFEDSGPWTGHWRDDQAPLSWAADAGALAESGEFWQTFDHCLAQLPEQMSIAFTLREIDGLSSAEICEILNVTPNNLWVLLHRSRNKLRNLLEVNWFSRQAAAA